MLPRRRHNAPFLGRVLWGLLLGAGLFGCSLEFKGVPTEWRLSDRSLEVLGEDAQARADLEKQLVRLFGTQASPAYAGAAAPLNERLPRAQWITTGDAQSGTESAAPSLAESAALYGEKCLYCHGNEGGGDGVTASSLSPMPRDFRRGIFKYDNLQDGARPELIDFVRVITNGIEGSAMPSLKHLTDAQIFGLAEYTRLLAIRGETESWLASEYTPGTALDDALCDETYTDLIDIWLHEKRTRIEAPEPAPAITKASIQRGHELFHDSSSVGCFNCHGTSGRGEGPSAWGFTPSSPDEKVALLYDAWRRPITPRRLDEDILLHGETAQVLFERLYLGIDGTPMAGLGGLQGEDGALLHTDADLWSLVHYVQAIRDPEWKAWAQELESNDQ